MSVLEPNVPRVMCERHNGEKMIGKYNVPVSPVSDWVDIHLDATVVSASPNDPIVAADAAKAVVRQLRVANSGTAVLIRGVYTGTVTQDPIIRVYGVDGNHFKGKNLDAIPVNCPDLNAALAVTLTVTPATDIEDESGNFYTEPIQFDARASIDIFCLVTTVSVGGTFKIQAKII